MPRSKEDILRLTEAVLEATPFYVVDAKVSRGGLIQVFIDHPERVTMDDCVMWHKKIEEVLDREKEDFELQVSSAGLDLPLKDVRQYFKRTGETLKIWTLDGRQIKGTLTAVIMGDESTGPVITIIPGKTRKKDQPEPLELALKSIRIAKIELKF